MPKRSRPGPFRRRPILTRANHGDGEQAYRNRHFTLRVDRESWRCYYSGNHFRSISDEILPIYNTLGKNRIGFLNGKRGNRHNKELSNAVHPAVAQSTEASSCATSFQSAFGTNPEVA